MGNVIDSYSLYQVPTAFLEGGWADRGQGNFLSLGWETVFEDRWTTSWPTTWRCGNETGILPTLLFFLKGLEILHQERRGQVKTIVMEHFNSRAHCPLLQCLRTTSAILAGTHCYFVVSSFKCEGKYSCHDVNNHSQHIYYFPVIHSEKNWIFCFFVRMECQTCWELPGKTGSHPQWPC